MQRIDLRGSLVPFTLLKISNVFRTLKEGEILEILLNDNDLIEDLVRIIPKSSYELILMEAFNQENQRARIQLRKNSGNEKRIFSLPTPK